MVRPRKIPKTYIPEDWVSDSSQDNSDLDNNHDLDLDHNDLDNDLDLDLDHDHDGQLQQEDQELELNPDENPPDSSHYSMDDDDLLL